jgi:Tfp pilus assembly protein PilN
MGLRRINLLPPEERQKVSRERGLMYSLLLLVLVVAVLGVLYVFEHQTASNKRSELNGLQAQVTQLQAQVAVLKPFELMQSQRAAMTLTASQIYSSRVIWSSLLEQLGLVIPDNVKLTSLAASVPPTMLAGSGGTTSAGATAVDITFAGVTYTHKDVAEFMTRLGLMPQLANVQLVSADASQSAAGSTTTTQIVSFSITAQLRPFLTPAPPLSGAPAGGTAATSGGTGQ